LSSVLERRGISVCNVKPVSTSSWRGCALTSLVMLKYCHVWVDVMVPHVLANEAPAEMVVHVDTCPWINYRLDATGST